MATDEQGVSLSGDENENKQSLKKTLSRRAAGEWQYLEPIAYFLTPNSLLSSDEQVNFRLKGSLSMSMIFPH